MAGDNWMRWSREVQIGLLILDLGYLATSLLRNVRGWPGLGTALSTNAIGGDFINMWSAAKLTIAGRLSEIYPPQAFMAFEHGTIPHDIGLRIWAYPPISLPLISPLAALDFAAAYIVWSLFGLLVLAGGVRRFGFGWLETAIIILSPAALNCIYYGQTGNVAAGLLLLALSGRRSGEKLPIVSAALLSVKPQIALLLPLLWLIRRYWQSLLWTVAWVLALVATSLLLYGLAPWFSYVFDTLKILDELERRGTGRFMDMIPSVFMSMRVLGIADGPAFLTHLAIAVPALIFCCWRTSPSVAPTRSAGQTTPSTVPAMSRSCARRSRPATAAGANRSSSAWPAPGGKSPPGRSSSSPAASGWGRLLAGPAAAPTCPKSSIGTCRARSRSTR